MEMEKLGGMQLVNDLCRALAAGGMTSRLVTSLSALDADCKLHSTAAAADLHGPLSARSSQESVKINPDPAEPRCAPPLPHCGALSLSPSRQRVDQRGGISGCGLQGQPNRSVFRLRVGHDC